MKHIRTNDTIEIIAHYKRIWWCLAIGWVLGLALFSLGLSIYLNLKMRSSRQEIINPVEESIIILAGPTPTPTPAPSYYYGEVSWYGQELCGGNPCKTANGDWFDENKFTTACSDEFKLGTRLVVSYEDKSVEVICNDRGRFKEKHNRILDLSKAAFKALAPEGKGVIWVRIKEIK